jgi:uncharacterized protein YdhG (YjbR/CyaY superfamily)
MAKTDFKTIDEYHQTFSGKALERLKIIREIIREVAPEAQEVISYQIPAFKIGPKFHLIYYCGFAKHVTLSSPWSEALLKAFEIELKGMKVSKSAIQFPLDKELSVDLIRRLVQFRKNEIEQNAS